MNSPTTNLSGITLRDYRSGDAAAMYALDIECFAAPFRFTSRAMRRFAEEPNAIVLLAGSSAADTPHPKLAGFVIAHMEGSTAYIVTLDVALPFRRQGLACLLVDETESRALSAGAQEIALHVFTGNSGAIAFYESLGYDRMRLAENFYSRGVHALVYRKKIGA